MISVVILLMTVQDMNRLFSLGEESPSQPNKLPLFPDATSLEATFTPPLIMDQSLSSKRPLKLNPPESGFTRKTNSVYILCRDMPEILFGIWIADVQEA